MQARIVANSRKRPVGLVVLACIQFLFAAVLLLALTRASEIAGVYGIVSPLLTGIAMIATGVGYLQRSWAVGFVGGNVLGFASLANILIYNATEGFANVAILKSLATVIQPQRASRFRL